MTRKKVKKTSTGRSKVSNFNKILILLAIIAIVVLAFTLIKNNNFNSQDKPFEVQEMPYDFRIKDNVGFNADTDMLHFGGGSSGFVGQRTMTITSPRDALVKISFEGPGDIVISDNNFYISTNDSKELNFSLQYPNLPLGNYSGVVYFSFYDVK